MATPFRLKNGEETGEGLGWGPREDWDGRRTLWGNGRTPGSTCGLMVFPDQTLSIALVSSVRGAPIENGEFYVLALRFLAAIEGDFATAVPADRLGEYELNLVQGETSYSATLGLESEAGRLQGLMELEGTQQFRVLDWLQIGGVVWIVLRDPSDGFLIPLRLRFKGDRLSVELLRTGLVVTGSRVGPSRGLSD